MAPGNFAIIEKERKASDLFRMRVLAPLIPPRAAAGQFIIIRTDEKGERIPLTLMDYSPTEGTVDFAFAVVGTTTDKLSRLEVGDCLADVVGPLGRPTETENLGRVACVAGGAGIAAIYPIARAVAGAGNDVKVLLGSKDRDHLILVDEIGGLSAELEIATDDGSVGVKGFVTALLERAIKEWRPDRVIAVGPVPMMRAVAFLTREHGIPTLVSLNSIMLDGTGMCGTCRVEIAGETKFCCVDGPEFDAHQVDWEVLLSRQGAYQGEEKESWDRFRKNAADYHSPCWEEA